MIFGDKSYFNTYFKKNALKFFQNSTMHRGQIHYPFVMFGMKASTKLDFYKNVSDKYFFVFCKKKIQDFYSLIAKFISDVTYFEKKTHKITYFQYKK